MEITEKPKFTKSDYQRICTVILKNDFSATWKEISEVLNLKQNEAKNLYLQLIRLMENKELEQRTNKPDQDQLQVMEKIPL